MRTWLDVHCRYKEYFICQIREKIIKEKTLEKIEFKGDKLNFASFDVRYKYRRTPNQQMLEDSMENQTVTGFTLNWFLKDANGTKLTEMLPAKPEDWKTIAPAPRYEQPWFRKMVMLAKDLRMKNLTRSQIIEKVIQVKEQNIVLLSNMSQCSNGHVNSSGYLNETFTKLVASVDEAKGTTTEEDLEVGFELFGMVTFCPTSAIQLYSFVSQLVRAESASTIIQTIVNTIVMVDLDDIDLFKKVGSFYLVIEKQFNMQYGKVLLALSTKSELQTMLDNQMPFLTSYAQPLRSCLNGTDCRPLQDVIQTLGKLSTTSIIL